MGLFKRKKAEKPFISVIIAAGGASARMGGENKLLQEINGLTVLEHTLLAFENCPEIDEIIIAAKSDMVVEYGNLASRCRAEKVKHIICGGKTRLATVYNAMAHVDPCAAFVAVHDGARPCITPHEITRVLEAAISHSAAVALAPINDTVKRMDGDLIISTEDRSRLFSAQTPQCADKALLYAALKKALTVSPPVTDESLALENMGVKPFGVVLSGENIKITTPVDLILAEIILSNRD